VQQENKQMSTKLNELRLQVERLDYEAKEGTITIETLREQNNDTTAELEALKKQFADLKSVQKDASADDKEKRKQEKMAMMMAKFDTVSVDSGDFIMRSDLELFRAARRFLREGRAVATASSKA